LFLKKGKFSPLKFILILNLNPYTYIQTFILFNKIDEKTCEIFCVMD